jgi:UDP-N-acetylglucosamine 3-dehydrogenase
MTRKGLRAAVIGLGFMGRNHLRAYGELDGVEVVAAADPDAAVLERAVRGRTARPYSDYRRLLREETPDLVSIAVPTSLHHEVALTALEAGVHVLIEKPIGSSVEQGKEIAEAARQRGLKATVGHVERFNPAVSELKRVLDEGSLGRVYQVQARRVGPFQQRMRDVGVARDLATHDLDVMRHILGSEVSNLYCHTQTGVRTQYEDALLAVLRFENGVSALLNVNWLSPLKVRELIVLAEGGMLTLDYINQELFVYKDAGRPSTWVDPAALRITPEAVHKLPVAKSEPLRAELEAFVRAVAEDEKPRLTCEDAIVALHLAEQLVESGMKGQALAVVSPVPGGGAA